MVIRAYDIDWDTDGFDVGLPTDITIEDWEPNEDDNYSVADFLSDTYGWCINKLSIDIRP